MISLNFTENQIEFMQQLGIEADFSNITDEDIVEIEDVVSEYLQQKGFDSNYSINDDGKMCESILDIL